MDSFKCEAFLMTAELGSLTAAADYLGYTQPGITRIIRSLEDEVGFSLLARSKKGVVLTENGKAMMPLFRELVRISNSASELSGEIRGVLSGTIVVGSYYSVSAMLLPEILKEFREQYPNIKIRLKEGNNQDFARWLTNKSVDCCFAIEPSKNVHCDWIPLLEEDLMVWLPSDHPLANAASYPISRLEHERFISTMPGQDTEIDRLFQKEGITPDVVFSTADAYAAYRMVEAGLGISINDKLFTNKWTGDVITLPFEKPQKITLGITVPSLREASPAAQRFIECIRNVVKRQGYDQSLR